MGNSTIGTTLAAAFLCAVTTMNPIPAGAREWHTAPLDEREAWLSNLSREELGALEDEGFVERSPARYRGLGLLPKGELNEEVYGIAREINPNIVSERIVVVDVEDRDAATRAILDLFNVFYHPGELANLTYVNERKGTTHDLFRDSFRVDGPETRRRLPDTELPSIPRSGTIWTVQGLPPFGAVLQDVRYRRLDFSNGRAGVLLTVTNEDPLTYRDIDVLQRGEMMTAFVVVPGPDFLVLYALGAARVRPVFALLGRDRIEASFSGRNAGLFDYLDQTYLDPVRRVTIGE